MQMPIRLKEKGVKSYTNIFLFNLKLKKEQQMLSFDDPNSELIGTMELQWEAQGEQEGPQ